MLVIEFKEFLIYPESLLDAFLVFPIHYNM